MVGATMPEHIRTLLMENLEIGPSDVYTVDGILALSALMELYRLDRPELIGPRLEMFTKRRLKWVAPMDMPQFTDMPH